MLLERLVQISNGKYVRFRIFSFFSKHKVHMRGPQVKVGRAITVQQKMGELRRDH
jgi:hypothetical protein